MKLAVSASRASSRFVKGVSLSKLHTARARESNDRFRFRRAQLDALVDAVAICRTG